MADPKDDVPRLFGGRLTSVGPFPGFRFRQERRFRGFGEPQVLSAEGLFRFRKGRDPFPAGTFAASVNRWEIPGVAAANPPAPPANAP